MLSQRLTGNENLCLGKCVKMNDESLDDRLSTNVDCDKNLEFQSDSLFLLIGTNPLPNYVAYQLLAKPDCHVYFVHTDQTGEIANRLADVLKMPANRWTKIPVKESNATNIYNEIYKCAKGKSGLGLNYTGGTKSMAVHSYRAIQAADKDAIFSYLNARTLEMMIDQCGRISTRCPANLCIELPMEDLLALHDYIPKELRKEPFHPEVCRDLIKIPRKELRCWCDNNLHSGPRTDFINGPKLKTIPLPQYEMLSKHWKHCNTLDELATMWNIDIGQIPNWLNGKWLEHYTLGAVQEVAKDSKVHDAIFNLDSDPKLNKRKFEVDVLALRGYQLFAISCATGDYKDTIKQKFFEAYVRARQLGGDEAKVAVVCFASVNNKNGSPDIIKKEIEEEWDIEKGMFRIFGVEDLPDLPAHLQEWFKYSDQRR